MSVWGMPTGVYSSTLLAGQEHRHQRHGVSNTRVAQQYTAVVNAVGAHERPPINNPTKNVPGPTQRGSLGRTKKEQKSPRGYSVVVIAERFIVVEAANSVNLSAGAKPGLSVAKTYRPHWCVVRCSRPASYGATGPQADEARAVIVGCDDGGELNSWYSSTARLSWEIGRPAGLSGPWTSVRGHVFPGLHSRPSPVNIIWLVGAAH